MNIFSDPAKRGMERRIKLSPAQTIAIGFAIIIFAGAVLLSLPISNRDRCAMPFGDALFTSASVTCITGLSLFDTWTQFSGFGQVLLLVLMQTGGLGFITMVVLFAFAAKKRLGLRERTYLSEAFNSSQLGGVVRLTRRIIIGTAFFELSGALLLSLKFCPRFGFWRGLWYSLFHSVSAFCNAGYELMGCIEPGSSLSVYANDWYVNLVVILLVIIGGIGFVVWNDLMENRHHWRKYSLHTKLVLSVTAAFIVVPAVMYFFTEKNASMEGMSIPDRMLASLFQSVTTRTAGFYTVRPEELSDSGWVLTVFLEFVGGAPGSTAGGVKISTFAVSVLAIYCYMKGKVDVNVFDRRLENTVIRRAFCALVFNLSLALCGVFIICAAQPLPLKDVILEVVSAVSTTGISAGITGELCGISRLVIMLLMYAGRVGSLAVLVTSAEPRSTDKLRNPEGKIIIG